MHRTSLQLNINAININIFYPTYYLQFWINFNKNGIFQIASSDLFNAIANYPVTNLILAKMPIEDPPNSVPDGPLKFPTVDALIACIQAFSKDNGFAVGILRRSNYGRSGQATRVELACDRGKKREARSKRLRATTTASCKCPWVVVANAYIVDIGA